MHKKSFFKQLGKSFSFITKPVTALSDVVTTGIKDVGGFAHHTVGTVEKLEDTGTNILDKIPALLNPMTLMLVGGAALAIVVLVKK